MIFVDHILRGNSLIAGFQRDGHPVFIGPSDEAHFLPLLAEVPGINIGGHIDTGEVPDVDR